jgi:hypothetical protein
MATKIKKNKSASIKTSKKSETTKGLNDVKLLVKAAKTEKTTLDTVYLVNDSDHQVTLEINIGAAGQTSNMTILLNEELLAENISGDFPETEIGSNAGLNGKKLSIVANVADTSKETNLTSLTIHLTAGEASVDFPLFKTVEENDSADYLCLIEFFNPLS